jgi:GGDEF domain-containing protein
MDDRKPEMGDHKPKMGGRDGLTGFLNRLAMTNNRADSYAGLRHANPCSVILFDIDYFIRLHGVLFSVSARPEQTPGSTASSARAALDRARKRGRNCIVGSAEDE